MRVRHEGVSRSDVAAFFSRRWPGSVLLATEPQAPPLHWGQADGVALAQLRRGCEPLRVILRPAGLGQGQQRQTRADDVEREPLPVIFGFGW